MTALPDEFTLAWNQLSPDAAVEIEQVFAFADLMWDMTRPADWLERLMADPGVEVRGHSRWFVLMRVAGELRFYAGPLPNPWMTEDPVRRAAIQAEADEHELGILGSLPDAVCFAEQYLEGRRLRDITIPRLPSRARS